MIKKYFRAVPLPLSIMVSIILGWPASGLFLMSLFSAGLLGLILFLAGSAAAYYFANLLLYRICTKRFRPKEVVRFIPLRAAVIIGVFLYMAGSFFWAGSLWGVMNDWWF